MNIELIRRTEEWSAKSLSNSYGNLYRGCVITSKSYENLNAAFLTALCLGRGNTSDFLKISSLPNTYQHHSIPLPLNPEDDLSSYDQLYPSISDIVALRLCKSCLQFLSRYILRFFLCRMANTLEKTDSTSMKHYT